MVPGCGWAERNSWWARAQEDRRGPVRPQGCCFNWVWTGQGTLEHSQALKIGHYQARIPLGGKSTPYILYVNHALFCLPKVLLYISKEYEKYLSFLLCLLREEVSGRWRVEFLSSCLLGGKNSVERPKS